MIPLNKFVKTLEDWGDDILPEEVANTLVEVRKALDILKDLEEQAKGKILEQATAEYGKDLQMVKRNKVTASFGKRTTYATDKPEFLAQRVDNGKISKYLQDNGKLPEGVIVATETNYTALRVNTK